MQGKRQSVAVTWGVMALIFLGATAVGGSSIRRYSALEQRLLIAETQAAERTAESAGLTQRIQVLSTQLVSLRSDLTMAKRSLKTTQSLLEDATTETRAANDAAEQQLRQIATLKACLAGAAQALQHVSARDSYGALGAMMAVDQECREAQALMAGQ